MTKPAKQTAADFALENREADLRPDARWLELPLDLRKELWRMERSHVRRHEMIKLIKSRGFTWSQSKLSEFFTPVNLEAAEIRKTSFASNQLAEAMKEGGDLPAGGQARIAKAFFDVITGAIDPTSEAGQALLLSAGTVFSQMQKAAYDTAKLTLDRERKKQKDQEIKLNRDKMEINASRLALKCLPALRKIAGDKSLNNVDRINAARRQLFGELPEDRATVPQEKPA